MKYTLYVAPLFIGAIVLFANFAMASTNSAKPFADIWQAIEALSDRINAVTVIEGPQGEPGLKGEKGEPGDSLPTEVTIRSRVAISNPASVIGSTTQSHLIFCDSDETPVGGGYSAPVSVSGELSTFDIVNGAMFTVYESIRLKSNDNILGWQIGTVNTSPGDIRFVLYAQCIKATVREGASGNNLANF